MTGENPGVTLERLCIEGLAATCRIPSVPEAELNNSEAELNKLQRHTIAAYLIAAQTDVLVEGTGAEARFRQPLQRPKLLIPGARSLQFGSAVQGAIRTSATLVEQQYTYGEDSEHRWWPIARDIYDRLGAREVELIGRRGLPRAGQSLQRSLRAPALAITMPFYAKFLRDRVNGRAERVRAGHDCIGVYTGWANVHAREFTHTRASVAKLHASVEQDESGVYRVAHGDRSNHDMIYRRFPDNPTLRMKCPSHVVTMHEAGHDDAHLPRIGETSPHSSRRPTNLENMIHAAVNALVDFDLL